MTTSNQRNQEGIKAYLRHLWVDDITNECFKVLKAIGADHDGDRASIPTHKLGENTITFLREASRFIKKSFGSLEKISSPPQRGKLKLIKGKKSREATAPGGES